MPKGFTDHEKERIKKRLLDQGYQQFSSFGLKKANVEELARAAGISKGAFYLFYESKEALFMDVVEEAEVRFRQQILAEIDQSEGTPRLRLYTVFKKAFTLWRTIPILRQFTRADYEMLSGRIPMDKLQEHVQADQAFLHELIDRCNRAGIPFRVTAEEINGLMYILFLTVLHEDDFGPGQLERPMNALVELVTAFCLGEISLQAAQRSQNKGIAI